MRRISVLIVAIGLLLIFVGNELSLPTSAQQAPGGGGAEASFEAIPAPTGGGVILETGRVIVRFGDGVGLPERASLHAQFNARVIDRIPILSVDVVEIANPAATVSVAEAYGRNPLVTYAEPDALAPLLDSPALIPNDPGYNLSDATRQWHHPAIDSPQAWPVATSAASLLLTVCDTGVLATHEDLAGQVRTDLGINTADEPATDNFSPVHWHGTAVSGSAAAVGNNGIGVTGVTWSVQIVPVRISNLASGGAFFSDMAQCIVYGAGLTEETEAKLKLPDPSVAINLSYQTYDNSGKISQTILDAAALANDAGSVLVVAAGNENKRIARRGDTDPEDILYVAATDEGDTESSFSNFGPFVDLAAPGSGILTTFACFEAPASFGCNESDTDIYAFVSGTSFSSPIVAGAIALAADAQAVALAALATDADRAAFLRDLMTNGACDLGASGEDDIFGAGLLNIHHAIHNEACSTTGGTVSIVVGPLATIALGTADVGSTATSLGVGQTLTITNNGSSFINLSVGYTGVAGANCGTSSMDWEAVAADTTPGTDQFSLAATLDTGGPTFTGVPTSGSDLLPGTITPGTAVSMDVELAMPSSSTFTSECTIQITVTATAS